MRTFIAELRRRQLYRITAGYVVVGLGVLGAAELILDPLGLGGARAYLVVLTLAGFPVAVVMAWAVERRTSPAARPAPSPHEHRESLVVLPFDNTSPDPADAYFSDGLTEEVIADLSRIRALGVISRTSAMRLRGTGKDVRTIGRELGVGYVLEGSVRKSGSDVRITAQLIDAESDRHIWSEKYAGTVDDVFEIQERVAGAIARALRIHLSPVERKEIADRGIDDTRAYESYLRARYEMWRFSREGLEAAERHIRNGLEIVGENEILLATLGLIKVHYFQSGVDTDPSHLEEAEDAVRRLAEVAPDSRRLDGLLGFIAFARGRMDEARPHLENALDHDPDDPDALLLLGYVYALIGLEDRASTLFARLLEVDPLTPMNHAMEGFVAAMEGRHQDMIEPYRTFLDMDDRGPFSLGCWVWALCHADDRLEEAADAARELNARFPGTAFASLATCLVSARRGDREAAGGAISPALLAAARHTEMFSRFLTECYALVGDTEEALAWLENTIRLGNVNHPYLSRISPFLVSVRGEPRFGSIMEDVERRWRGLSSGA